MRTSNSGISIHTLLKRAVKILLLFVAVLSLVLFKNIVFSQTTIAFNGAESSGTTWTTSSNNFSQSSTNTGTPTNERIKNGSNSWQKANGSATLITNSASTVGYSNCFVEIWNASISGSTGNGIESGEGVKIYVSNSTTFSTTPDVNITTNTSNTRWGMSGTGMIETTAGTAITYTYSSGGTNTGSSAFSMVKINIPSTWTTVYLKIVSTNNDSNEIFCIDDITLKGTVAATDTRVAFNPTSGTTTENAGTYSIPLAISTPSTSATTTATIKLISGDPSLLTDFAALNSTVSVVIPANTSSYNYTLNLTDNSACQENGNVVFQITAVTGGVGIAAPGTDDSFTLTIGDNEGVNGIFKRISFEGSDTWTYAGNGATNTDAGKKFGTTSYQLGGLDNLTTENISLIGIDNVQLSVAFASSGVDSGEDLMLEISYDNGSTWNGTGTVKLVDGYSNADIDMGATNASNPTTVATNPWTVDIDPSETQIKVRLRANSMGGGEYYYVDDITLSGNSCPACTSADALAFEIQPTTVEQDITMSIVKVKAICSSDGSTATSYSGDITLNLNAPGCGYDAQTVTAVNGVATFNAIQIRRSAQTGLNFTATASGLTSATSSNFNVTVPSGTSSTSTIIENNFDATQTWTYNVGTPTTYGSGGSTGSDLVGIVTNAGTGVLRKSYSVSNGSGEKGTENTISFANVTGLSGYSQVVFTFNVLSFGSGTGAGVDSDENFEMQVSTDGGSTWTTILTQEGSSNRLFAQSTSPVTALDLSSNTVISSGTKSAFKLTLTGISQFRFRFIASTNRTNENWAIDNVKLTGTTTSSGTQFGMPTVDLGSNFAECSGTNVQLNSDINSYAAPLSYSWTNSSELTPANGANPVANFTQANRTYTLTVTDGDNCKGSGSVTVTNNGFGGTAGLWTGAFDDNWFDCRNWSNGIIPTATTHVTINQSAANACRIEDDNAFCNTLNLSSNNGTSNNLSIIGSGKLTVSYDVAIEKPSNNSTVKIQLLDQADFECRNLTMEGNTIGGGNAKFQHELPTTSVLIRGNVTIENGGELDLSDGDNATTDGTIQIQGNYINNALETDFKEGNSTVLFNGTGNQSISTNSFNEVFYTIEVNKASGILTVFNSSEITKSLEFTNGIIASTAANLVIFRDNSTANSVSDNSHVKGYVRKIGNDAFTFPVGNGTYYRPISMSAPGNTAHHFTATYNRVNPTGSYNTALKDISLHHLSSCEYWILDRTNGTSNVNVTLSWNANTSCGVTDLTTLRVARWDGSKWKDHGNGGTTGNTSNGTIISAAVISSFSPFTLASTVEANPLPVELLYFESNCELNRTQLNWATASEINASHFELEGSRNGMIWEKIGSVDAQGTSMLQNTYSFAIPENLAYNYFRLKQLDLNGNSEYFQAIYSNCSENSEQISCYPNPTQGDLTLIGFSSESKTFSYQLVNLQGKVVQAEKDLLNTGKITLNISQHAAGTYVLKVWDKNGIVQFAEKINLIP